MSFEGIPISKIEPAQLLDPRTELVSNKQHALVAPPLGNQRIGMGFELAQQSPAAARVWENANKVLGFNLTDKVWNGKPEDLRDSRVGIPASVAKALAHKAALVEMDQYDHPYFHTGPSLSLIVALVTSGALSVEGSVALSKLWDEAFQYAIDHSSEKSTMALLRGVSQSTLNNLLESGLTVTNYYSHKNIVIGGEVQRLREAIDTQEELRRGRNVFEVDIDIAFHSGAMSPAMPMFQEGLEKIPFNSLEGAHCVVVGGVTGAPLVRPEDFRRELGALPVMPDIFSTVTSNLDRAGVVQYTELNDSPITLGFIREDVEHWLNAKTKPATQIRSTPLPGKDKGVIAAQRWNKTS